MVDRRLRGNVDDDGFRQLERFGIVLCLGARHERGAGDALARHQRVGHLRRDHHRRDRHGRVGRRHDRMELARGRVLGPRLRPVGQRAGVRDEQNRGSAAALGLGEHRARPDVDPSDERNLDPFRERARPVRHDDLPLHVDARERIDLLAGHRPAVPDVDHRLACRRPGRQTRASRSRRRSESAGRRSRSTPPPCRPPTRASCSAEGTCRCRPPARGPPSPAAPRCNPPPDRSRARAYCGP